MSNWTLTPHSDELVVIPDVELWTAATTREHVDVFVRGGRLVDLKPAAARINRRKRLVLMPSAVDTQVHLRTPGQPEKETPETGLRAALYGGVGALLTMPNTKPIMDSVEVMELAERELDRASRLTGVAVYLSVAGTIGQKGIEVAPLESLAAAGARAVTDDGKGVADDAVQLEIFKRIEALNLPFLQHAETLGAPGPLADGPVTRALGLKPYGPEHETDMVARDLRLLKSAPAARYHLLHTSAKGSIALVKAAKEQGLRVTAEVSPHHLYFSSDDIREDETSFKMNPPIRSVEDREALIDALAAGDIDWVATDHAPHDRESKAKPFAEATFGTLGLETMVPVVLDLVSRGRLSQTRAVQVLSTEPARFLGLDDEFGHLRLGQPLRAILVQPDESWVVQASTHQSLSKNTCFDGVQLNGKVVGQCSRSGIWLAEEASVLS
ncbi:MAG: dihydroorotase [Bdellovibrionaceae bacterium]|nr:dihydroorotase [Pseudobdellovibrionaceae bacterium]